jgi:mitosis inhibitor protein kinase SWE1
MNVPFSPSPLSPSRRSTSDNTLHIPSSSLTPSHAIPYPPSARASRPTLRRSVQSQNISRSTRTSPKSPSKRPLADLSDGGNVPSMPLRKRSSTDAQCDYPSDTFSLVIDKENDEGMDFICAPTKVATSRAEKRVSGNFGFKSSAASPMKRNDGAMTVERPDFESPSAKRRSLHGPISDFNIFESEPQRGESERRSMDEIDWSTRYALPPTNSYFNTIPKRSSSLRKSTLQQRQFERPMNPKGSSSSQSMTATPGIPNPRKGQRFSLDNYLPPLQRDSPFSSQGSLLNASIHPVGPGQSQSQIQSQTQNQHQGSQASNPPHPLSRTMTQSSSTSSLTDDSPTHEPIHRPDRPKSMFDFAKSLPIGSSRPAETVDEDAQESSQGSFATPANYKSAKPLPAAFMSTGLISKKNRNVDDPNGGLPKAHMPDTPCKKQVSSFPAVSKIAPSGAQAVARPARHSFGTPSTPLNSHHSVVKPAPFTFGKGIGIFGANGGKNTLTKKASFASIDGEEHSLSQSPTTRDSQNSTDSEYPPTPTKRVLGEQQSIARPSNSRSGEKFRLSSSFSSKPITASRLASSKLSPIGASPGSVDGDSDSVMEDSPSASLRPKSTLTVLSAPSSSFTRGRLLRNLNSPTPLSRKALTLPPFGSSPRSGRTKLDCLSPVSPNHETTQRSSPHTPQEHLLPPDPSGLSISGHNERPLFHRGTSSPSGLPATPTGPRDYFRNFSNRQSLNLNAGDAADVDQCLVSKFERVELVGSGEFSQVFRVAAAPNTSPYHSLFSLSAPRSSSRSSLPERVFAVKKSRHAYSGAKDRQRKIHEVDVLKTLGHSDHVLSFVDSWEDQCHLYIQTEFCEEGSLDVFLAQVGVKARLDDFRIWKMLLELSLVCPFPPLECMFLADLI